MKTRLVLLFLFFCATWRSSLAATPEEIDWDKQSLSGHAAYDEGRMPDAERIFRQCMEGAEKFDLHNPRRAMSINNLAAVYYQQGKFDDAEKMLDKALELHKSTKDDQGLCSTYNNLGTLYVNSARFEQAGKAFQQALAVAERSFGPDSVDVADILVNVGANQAHLAKFAEAEATFRRAIKIRKDKSGDTAPQTLNCIVSLANCFQIQERFTEAETLYTEILPAVEKELRPEHYLVARTLNNLGAVYCHTGRLVEAEQLLRRALELRMRYLPAGHPDIAMTLGELGLALFNEAKYAEAGECIQRQIEMLHKIYPDGHLDLAIALNLMANLAAETRDYETAERLHRQALELRMKFLPAEHPEIANSLTNLAALLFFEKKYDEAEPLYLRALAIQEKALGADALSAANTMLNMAVMYAANPRDPAKIESLYQRGMNAMAKALGPENPALYIGLENWAYFHLTQGKREQGIAEFAHAFAIQNRLRSLMFATSSERQRLAWANAHVWLKNDLFTIICSNLTVANTGTVALDAALHAKSSTLEAMIDERAAILSSTDPALMALAGETESIRRKLAARILSQKGTPDQELETKLAELEAALALKSAAYSGWQKTNSATEASIAQALPKGSVFISFVYFVEHEHISTTAKPPRYAALVLPAGGHASCYDLGPAEPIETAVHAFLDDAAGGVQQIAKLGEAKACELLREKGQALATLLLKPIWREIADRPRWIVSPDGLLSVVPFAALPDPGAPERWCAEQHEITFALSGREIAGFGQRPAGLGAASLILANPDFGISLAKPVGAGDEKNPFAAQNPALAVELHAAAARSNDFRAQTWNALPGTAEEAAALGQLFKERNLSCVVKAGAAATKQALFDADSPRFLHIATHGFYLPDQVIAQTAEPAGRGLAGIAPSAQGGQAVQLALPPEWANVENPLLRSGLVFAGANRDAGSGVATAQELTGLRLSGTELVVLSACETGLGGLTSGEDVMGLRRSFLASGARALLTSLWRVADRETKDLMTAFYRRKLSGERTGAALQSAMQEIREARTKSAGAAHPYFWAAFVLIGDPD